MSDAESLTEFEQAVASVLRGLRPGDVVTYGEVAAEAGYPKRARAVGAFLAEHGDGYPWWRVVTATGRLVPGHEADHRRRLRREGVDVGERVRLRAQWARTPTLRMKRG
jgi:methylated-DNA-protein-cysteine methyltransferase-like protein